MSEKSRRLLRIYALLKRQPVTIETLSHWAGKNKIQISERTFYRDLKILEDSMLSDGEVITVKTGEKNKKTWKIEFRGDDRLTEYDIDSYLLFKNFLSLPIVQSRRESLQRIEEIFYKTYSKSRFENFAAFAENQLQASHFGQFHYEEKYKKLLEDLVWSIRNCRIFIITKIEFDITSIAESVAFPLEFFPLKLIYHRGILHLGGMVKHTGKPLVVALSQIAEYSITNSQFSVRKRLSVFEAEMQKRFGITENMDDAVYDIELEFSESLGCFVREEFWHLRRNSCSRETATLS